MNYVVIPLAQTRRTRAACSRKTIVRTFFYLNEASGTCGSFGSAEAHEYLHAR